MLMTNEERTKRLKEGLGRTKLKCYDLLDDIDKRDLKPLQSEYPRRDHLSTIELTESQTSTATTKTVISKKPSIKPTKRPKKSLLHRMVAIEDEKMLKKLVQPQVALRNQGHHRKLLAKHGKNVTNLMEYLTSPSHRFLQNKQQSVICMPVRVYYDNFPTKDGAIVAPTTRNGISGGNSFVTDLTKMQKTQPEIVQPPVQKSTPFLTPRTKEGSEVNTPREQSNQEKSVIDNVTMASKLDFEQIHPRVTKKQDIRVQSPRLKKGEELITPRFNALKSPAYLNRKKMMLEHLKGLKVRNDSIQKNIQKAIDVIETKMIDILSAPPDANSSEAFNVMEQEITKVLKMMNEGEKKELEKKMEKYEAEKDENQPKNVVISKLKPSKGGVKKSTPTTFDVVPGVDLPVNHAPKEKDVVDKTPDTTNNAPKKNTDLPHKRPTNSNKSDEVKIPRKILKSPKRAADIEEGERLLGQVDSVIKKIDNMYSKLYSEKPKTHKKDHTFNQVVDFFDGLKKIIDVPAEIHHQYSENVAHKFQQAQCYYQPRIYHRAVFIPDNRLKDQGDNCQKKDDDVMCEMRHEMALKTFYTLFFSTFLIALSFDFSC